MSISERLGAFAEAAAEQRSAMSVNHVRPVPPNRATGRVAQIYAALRRDFIVAPPFTMHSQVPDILAVVGASYCETVCAGLVPRAYKEAVATGVSEANSCPFCAQAHATAIEALIPAQGLAGAVTRGQSARLDDTDAQAYLEWGRATALASTAREAVAPFNAAEAPEVIGTAVAFHYVNRMVSVFANDTAMPIPKQMAPLSDFVRKVGASYINRVVSRQLTPGSWLDFIPVSGNPDDIKWAAGNEAVARVFAGMNATVEACAARYVPGEVRELIRSHLKGWNGEEAPLGKAWLDEAIEPLEDALRPAARLGLMTARGAYRVEGRDINDYRSTGAGDEAVVVLCSWSSLTAANRIAEWIA